VRWLAGLTDPAAAGAGDRQGAQAQIVGEHDDVVRVMTVHQAKGLEFDVVAVGGCGAVDPQEPGPVYYDPRVGLGIKLRDGADLEHTGPSRRVQLERQARAQAESVRLFYVAATRAKDRLLLAGEARSSNGNTRTWRTILDAARAADPGLAALITETAAEALLAEARATAVEPAAAPALVDGDAARAEAIVARVAGPSVAVARTLSVAVTQLADFELCPRRYHLFHVVGLEEHPRAARPAAPDVVDPELDPLARGTLAHHLLERADFAAGGGDLDGLLLAAGYDPSTPEIAEVREHARGLLRTAFVREIAAAPETLVRRELPFVLPVRCIATNGSELSLRLRGQIDLLIAAGDEVTVVDYKHARRGADDDYRFQLDAYGLAATRLFPSARRVRVGLSFLREADPTPRFHAFAADDAHRFEASLATLGLALAAAPSRARAGGEWEGRPVDTCRALGCGYLYRCHPSSRTP